ncbi:glycosyltransferase family 39 protein [Candidatus Woesearchaeota archaeon]|nr:glycosyltransferase family 39 protein [Candidatus Woesearchaeota archaeon]
MQIKNWKLILDIIILLFLFSAGAAVRLYDLNGQGPTFDESGYFKIATKIYGAIKEKTLSEEYWGVLPTHPPVGSYIHTLFYIPTLKQFSTEHIKQLLTGKLTYQDGLSGEQYTSARYASVLLGTLTILITYLFCKRFLNRTTGVIAALILIVLPNFIPHHKIATLDSTVAFFYTLTITIFAYTLISDKWNDWIFLGILTGLGFAVKFIMVLLLPAYVLVYLVWNKEIIKKHLSEFRQAINEKQSILKNSFNTLLTTIKELYSWKLFLIPFIMLLVLFLTYPYLWPEPSRFTKMITFWKDGPGIEPWFGQMTEQGSLQSYYLVYFVFTTPVLILLLFLISLHYNWKNKTFWNMFVLLWFATPFLWSFSIQKTDGMRYLTMIYPPLAILAAQGLQHALRTPKKLFIGIAILLVYLIAIDAWIHPYYLDYYNILIGGPKNVQEKNLLEFNWFGEGKKELVEWINKNAEQNSAIAIKWNPSHDFAGWREDLFIFDLINRGFTGNPDYVLINHRYKQYDEKKDHFRLLLDNYKLVYTIKAGNGALGWVYKKT